MRRELSDVCSELYLPITPVSRRIVWVVSEASDGVNDKTNEEPNADDEHSQKNVEESDKDRDRVKENDEYARHQSEAKGKGQRFEKILPNFIQEVFHVVLLGVKVLVWLFIFQVLEGILPQL